jgi:penicillin-binding protein 2
LTIAQDEKYDAKKIREEHRDNAMYVGYAPYDKPQIAISVVLENAGHGGSEAAPIAKVMMDYYFKDQVFPKHQLIESLGSNGAVNKPLQVKEAD